MAGENEPVQVPTPASDIPEAKAVETPPASDAAATPPPTPIDWKIGLDSADAKDLQKHPKIAGIIGSREQQARADERRRLEVDALAKAQSEERERLRRMAEEDPYAFSQQWLSEEQRREVKAQLDNQQKAAKHSVAQSVGKAYANDIADMTTDEMAALTTMLSRFSDDQEDEAISAFANFMHDFRGKKWKAKELAQEVAKEVARLEEVIRNEVTAKVSSQYETPGNGKPPKGAPAGINIATMPDDDFNRYWDNLKNQR